MGYRIDEYPTSVRLPRELRAWLLKMANKNRQPLTQAIIQVLQRGRKRINKDPAE